MSDAPADSATAAVLFDIDGTLVDSNYLHVEAWAHAFADLAVPVDSWRIHRSIGMDSAKLLDELLGDRRAELEDEAKAGHSRYYEQLFDRLRPFDGARELVAELSRRGARVVFATSAPEHELEVLQRTLDVDQYIADETSAGDVETAKPEPDLIEAALAKAGAPATRAIMIGDSVWDVISAGGAGVECVGVLSGGTSEAELLEAGAVEVHADVAALLEALDRSAVGRLLD